MKSYIEFIFENVQLADKIYFKTGKLSEKEKSLILSITNSDNYTKILSDILYYFKTNPDTYFRFKIKSDFSNISEKLQNFYNLIKSYDKNTIPIIGLNSINNVESIGDVIFSLEKRNEIINELKKLPSIGIRNLRTELREERSCGELERYLDLLQYFTTHLSMLSNRDEKTREKIYQKLFKNNVTLNQLIDFVDDKTSLIGGEKVTKNGILKLVKENNDMELIYNKNNIIVVRIESPQAIKDIGCNSLWCFTYGSGFDNAYRTWNTYSTNDIVYVIINFNNNQDDPDFMNVLIKPIDFKPETEEDNDEKMFDLTNVPQFNSLNYLKHLFGIKTAKKLFTFQWDDSDFP